MLNIANSCLLDWEVLKDIFLFGHTGFVPSQSYDHRVGIQKPVVTYDLGKFSVTDCARLPNNIFLKLLFSFYSLKNYFLIVFALKYCNFTPKRSSAKFNKNGKNLKIKNIWQCCKQIWTHSFSVVTYNVVSYYRFLKTDPGANPTTFEFTTMTPAL
jgi:hypothetical protein